MRGSILQVQSPPPPGFDTPGPAPPPLNSTKGVRSAMQPRTTPCQCMSLHEKPVSDTFNVDFFFI